MLTCKTSRNYNDWSKVTLMIMGHRFCEDVVGYEINIALNISGVFINRDVYESIYYSITITI